MRFRLIRRPPVVRALGYWSRAARRAPAAPYRATRWTLLGWLMGSEAAPMTAAGYEAHCAEMLRAAGCRAKVVGQSGDQGADIMATVAGVRLVVQCKFHTRPVSNRAVQEVHAARGFHGHDVAAVVTDAGYTASAVALADRLGVHLLRTADLSRPERIIRRT